MKLKFLCGCAFCLLFLILLIFMKMCAKENRVHNVHGDETTEVIAKSLKLKLDPDGIAKNYTANSGRGSEKQWYSNSKDSKPFTFTYVVEKPKIIRNDNKHKGRLSSGDNILKSFYTKMNYGPVYLLGAAAGNSSWQGGWDLVKIYGIVDLNGYGNVKFRCCLKYTSQSDKNSTFKVDPMNVVKFWKIGTLRAHHFTCPNIKHENRTLPVGVALTKDKLPCEESNVNYIKPFTPLKETKITLAIGTKLAFGNISAEMIIEWMETYKFLGVDKVVTYYVDEINVKALKVLRYYASTKFLDLYHHKAADSDLRRRDFNKPTPQKWNDNQMLIFDSFERMSGYTYFGIIDLDEFLIPSSNRSLKQMLAELQGSQKRAAGFIFQSQYYYLSWGQSGAKPNDLILGTYTTREASNPRLDNQKAIYMPPRIAFGGVHTHYITPVPGYTMEVAPSELCFIRHYRHCRHEERWACLHEFERKDDTSVAAWSRQIKHNVHKVRKAVFGKRI